MTIYFHPNCISCFSCSFIVYPFNEIWLACHPETRGDTLKASLQTSFYLLIFFYLCLASVACCGCKDEPSSDFVDGDGSHIDSQENAAQGVLSGYDGTEGFNLQLSPAHHIFIVVSQHTQKLR